MAGQGRLDDGLFDLGHGFADQCIEHWFIGCLPCGSRQNGLRLGIPQIIGQHGLRDQSAIVQHHHVADDVQQLAHIAGPRKPAEQRAHLWGQAIKMAAFLVCKTGEGGFCNLDHVICAFAQRRHVNGHHVKAVIEVFAKLAAPHGIQRVYVGGADNADVHLARAGGADGLHGGGLQETQQFGLQRRGHFADFIKEKRAAIGSGGGTRFVGNGTGERAFHVTEHFGFQQVLRDGPAVQRDERACGAVGIVMHRQCTEFFAGAAFPGDEHGCHRPRDGADFGMDTAHRIGRSDKGTGAAGYGGGGDFCSDA